MIYLHVPVLFEDATMTTNFSKYNFIKISATKFETDIFTKAKVEEVKRSQIMQTCRRTNCDLYAKL